MKIDFSGRHVVVTGGTGALGAAVVRMLLEAGATCSVTSLDEGEVERSGLLGDSRVRIAMGVDLRDERAVERFYAEAAEVGGAGGSGGLWGAVHVAGGFAMGPTEGVSKADFMAQVEMNALTCFLGCREAVRRMGSRGGRIVNVAARPALEPRMGAGMVAYTASKAAVAAITQALAEEVVGRGILVNAVAPSVMDTPANRQGMPGADFSKWAKVEEVAATVCFLASPQNVATRGGLVPVYGRT